MKKGELILQLENIAGRMFTKDDQHLFIDLAVKKQSASIVIDNYKLFCINEKTTDVKHFIEWFEEMIDNPEEFPGMPWGEK